MELHETIEWVFIECAKFYKVDVIDIIRHTKATYKRDKRSQEYRNNVAQCKRMAIIMLNDIYSKELVQDIFGISYSQLRNTIHRYETLSWDKENVFYNNTKNMILKQTKQTIAA